MFYRVTITKKTPEGFVFDSGYEYESKKEMFEDLVKYRDAANDALMKLQAYGIATDLWEDKSWGYITNSEWDDCFVTYCHEMIHKDRLCLCRFIGENRKGGTIFM